MIQKRKIKTEYGFWGMLKALVRVAYIAFFTNGEVVVHVFPFEVPVKVKSQIFNYSEWAVRQWQERERKRRGGMLSL